MTTATTTAHLSTPAGLRLGYRELGSGSAVLLIHGWPTSSFLWRNVMPAIAERNRVVAIDLPGFGVSDKLVGVRYDFRFYEDAIDEFLTVLGIDRVAIAVHDLGGPIGVHWALRNRDRVTRLALTNTLIYPEFSEPVQEFIKACASQQLRDGLTSPTGLRRMMQLGLADQADLTDEILAAVLEPFGTAEARRALADAAIGLELDGFQEIAQELPTLDVPVRIVYGAQDRILADVDETMARVAADLPQAVVSVLPGCGHFLQEEAPATVGELLAEFFAETVD